MSDIISTQKAKSFPLRCFSDFLVLSLSRLSLVVLKDTVIQRTQYLENVILRQPPNFTVLQKFTIFFLNVSNKLSEFSAIQSSNTDLINTLSSLTISMTDSMSKDFTRISTLLDK